MASPQGTTATELTVTGLHVESLMWSAALSLGQVVIDCSSVCVLDQLSILISWFWEMLMVKNTSFLSWQVWCGQAATAVGKPPPWKSHRAVDRYRPAFCRIIDALAQLVRLVCKLLLSIECYWVFFELYVAYYGDYIVQIENILNPFLGILEAFAKLTSLVVRKGPKGVTSCWDPGYLAHLCFKRASKATCNCTKCNTMDC